MEGEGDSNERLEFLGDAVLSLVIGHYLYNRHPKEDEGYLSKIRARVVNRELFNELGAKMKLASWLDKVAPMKADTHTSPTLLGNAFEALVGAIFLDKGYQKAIRFFENVVLVYHLDIEEVGEADNNFKSKLLEWGQKNNRNVVFNLIDTAKMDNKLIFEVNVLVDEVIMGNGRETRKKKAEQMAAKEAIDKLGLE